MTTLWTAVAAVAAARPAAVALIEGDARVTYAALVARAGAVAAALGARGLGVGDRVGLALPRSAERVAAMLAIWRIGAVLVPRDPAWRAQVPVAHEIDAPVPAGAGDPPTAALAADAVALELATSGSTGAPKLVPLTHAAVLARLAALARAEPYAEGDVACHRAPAVFVDAYAEVLGPLLAGIPAVVLPEPLTMAELAAALGAHAVTRLLIVPSLLALLLDAAPALPAALRLIAVSGEPLTPELAARVFAGGRARLVNIYGATEVGGDATLGEVRPGEPVTIGRPLDGALVRVVDDELWVAGPMLARGYRDDPAQTAARFVHADGQTWFRTGDRARALPDGRLVLLGRLDDQVKVAGVRVELGEVEAALLALPGVDAACAALVDGRLVAGLVGPGAAAVTRAALGGRAAARPSLIAALPVLPLTASGKRDRAAVAVAVLAATDRRVDPAADARVAAIAGWFAALTGVAAGPDDDLGALGGDSLARLGLLVHLERAGWHLGHADLPTPLTPAALAARLPPPAPEAPFAPAPEAPFAVTDFQRVMVLEALANRGAPMWLDQVAYTLPAGVDVDRLAAALRAEVAACPALRLQFVVGADVEQVVAPEVPVELAVVDARGLDAEAYRVRVRAEEWTRLSRVFDLARAPLWAACVVVGAARCDLVFTYHHAILDGESARRVLHRVLARAAGEAVTVPRESFRAAIARGAAPAAVAAVRARLVGGAPPPDPPEPDGRGQGDLAWRLFHGALGLRAWLAARRVRRHRARLPLTFEPAVYAGGDVTSQPLPAVLRGALASWARAQGATLVAVWATALAVHLARERRTRDVLFGVVVAGRDGRSAETIGMLANCLPLRVALAPDATIAEAVRVVAAGLGELTAAGRAPLLDVLHGAGVPARAVLDTVLTVWQFPPVGPLAIPARGGRGVTLSAPRTAVIVGADELAVGARAFHRTDRVRRELLAIVDAILATPPEAPLARLLEIAPHEGGLSIAQPDL